MPRGLPAAVQIGLNSRRAVASVLPFATASADLVQVYAVKLPIGKTLTIDWGDGNSDDYAGNNTTSVAVTHTYAGAGSYDIIFKGDYTDLTYLLCNSNSLSGDVSGWSSLTSLTYLNCRSNSLTGDVSGWSALTSLTVLSCRSNSLDFDNTTAWAALSLGTTCYLQNNSMTSTQVDNALIAFAGGPFLNTTITLSGTNAARTSDSDAAVTTLEANGCTIITS